MQFKPPSMINKCYSVLTLFIVLLSLSFDGLTQVKPSSDLTLRAYGGASFLPINSSEVESSYYQDLRFGYNFGSDITVFLADIGFGFCYDQSSFSAKNRTLRNSSIDENYSLHYFGPLIASRVRINKENHLIFSISYGKSIAINNAIIDGEKIRFKEDNWIPKFAFRYEYHFSDISLSAGVQYINENNPPRPSLWGIQTSGFWGSPGTTRYSYTSGIDLDRLSLTIGLSYHLKGLFP